MFYSRLLKSLSFWIIFDHEIYCGLIQKASNFNSRSESNDVYDEIYIWYINTYRTYKVFLWKNDFWRITISVLSSFCTREGNLDSNFINVLNWQPSYSYWLKPCDGSGWELTGTECPQRYIEGECLENISHWLLCKGCPYRPSQQPCRLHRGPMGRIRYGE